MWAAFATVPRFIQRVVNHPWMNLREEFSAADHKYTLSDEPEENLVADGLAACGNELTYSIHGHLSLIDKLSRFLQYSDT
jgi:hypothetical protein